MSTFNGDLGFLSNSAGKELACNAGDSGSIPGSGRYTGEAIGYPLPYLGDSLVAKTVKNPPAIQETWVWSLGWEDPLEKGKATCLSWRIPIQYMVSQKLSDFHFHFHLMVISVLNQKAHLTSKVKYVCFLR